jgi:ketosteroid isomerase-like protein
MRSCGVMLLIACVIAGAGCRPAVDLEAARAALERTDREWSAATAEGTDVDRIVGYWSDDATVYPPGMPALEGKAAIREFVAESLRTPGFAVHWEPHQVAVSADASMGYTAGTNRFTAPGADGQLVTTEGRYLTVFRRQPDGAWKCVLDMWNVGADAR